MTPETDVAVIGAGAAGLAAGARLQASGVRFTVLEAASHAGGRAETDMATLGTPADLGCHWLHDALENPLVPVAQALGFALYQGRRSSARGLHLGTRFADLTESEAAWEAVDAAFDAVRAAGEAGRDVSASDVLPPARRWAPLVRHWLAFMTSLEPERISTRDFALYRDGEENWAVLDGMGALILALARDVPVTLRCPVTRIDRTGPALRLETARGPLSCRAVIVTASTAVMAQERLRFFPALPPELVDAFAALPLGTVEKVLIAFDRDVFGVPARTGLDAFDEALPERGAVSVLLRPGEANGAVVHLVGAPAAALLEEGEDAMTAFALDALAQEFGASIKGHVARTRASRWGKLPYIGGAYSCALPGQAHLRARLHEGLDERIFFAGEALGREAFSTCHGAHLSGIAAAAAALKSMGVRA